MYTFDFHRDSLLGLVESLDLGEIGLVVQDWGGLIGLTLPMAAPYPNASYKAGVRHFPNQVPDLPDTGGADLSREARDFWRTRWTGKSLMAIGMKDPLLGPPVTRALHGVIRNCPPPIEIAEGGHFLQEWGKEIAAEAVRVL